MSTCTNCDLYKNCGKPLQMGNGTKAARIMIVSENPYDSENKRQQYMGGKGGKLLRMALGEVGIDTDEVYFTAAVKCTTPEDRLPTPGEGKACRDYLLAEIDVIKPEIIVPTGNVSLKSLLNLTGITKHRGKVVEKEGIKYLPTYHPNMVLKQPKYMDDFSRDMWSLGELFRGKEALPGDSRVPEYLYCETFKSAIDEINRLNNLPKGSKVVLDIETVKLNPFKPEAKVVAIGFSDIPYYGCAIPLYHRETPLKGNEIGAIVKHIRDLLNNEDLEFVAHNGKFDCKYLAVQLDLIVKNFIWDPQLIHYLCITEEKGTHGLKELAWHYTDMGGYDNKLDELHKKLPEADRGNFDLIPWEELKVYLCGDVDCTFRVLEKFLPELENNEDLKWLYFNLIMPASHALQSIETNGLYVDKEWLAFLKEKYPQEIARIEDKLHQFPEVLVVEREANDKWLERCAIGQIKKASRTEEQQKKFEIYKKFQGFKFNFGSVQQLQDLLFNRLGLKTNVLTDKGQEARSLGEQITYKHFSTNDDSLKGIKHPISDLLLEFRKVKHLDNNFVSGMHNHLCPDGCIRPSFLIHGTVTGRLSSSDPNGQQIPRVSNDPLKFQYWHEIKKLFVSRFGKDGVILQADYSQLELRILAVMSGDPVLIDEYRQGKDLHRVNASESFGIPIEEVTKDQRTYAKKVSFGVVYQESARGLADDLLAEGIQTTESECQKFIDKWYKKYAGVNKWVKEVKRSVKRDKYIVNALGRIRHLQGVDSIETSIANEALRQGVNSPVQSTGSECTLMSIILINKWLKETGKKSLVCLTVHDSIVLDVHKEELVEVYTKVKHIMENLALYNDKFSFLGDVPIITEIEVGYNYGDAFEITPEDIQKYDIDEFLGMKLQKKLEKEQEAFKKAEDKGTKIPEWVYGYWQAS